MYTETCGCCGWKGPDVLVACLDLEGVLVPEIWIGVAERTGIDELRLTTRDISDYDELMRHRLRVLDAHGIGLAQIQEVIATMEPLPGAAAFLDWLRERFQVVILSDTFYEFGMPLMAHLGHPTLLCHRLNVVENRIVGYTLRQTDQKTKAVAALQSLNLTVIASGDSYNDTGMLTQAQAGILFDPPASVVAEFPHFPVARDYDQLRVAFSEAAARVG
jgi:phosphoserine/homoserine phosphotransferase